MNKPLNLFLVLLVALSLGLSLVALNYPAPVPGPQGPPGKDGDVGALSSPDIQSDWLRVGGFEFNPIRSDPFKVSSSTVCSFPLTGTTTVLSAWAGIKTSTGTAMQFEWGLSALMDATTTSLNKFTLAADVQGTTVFFASTTADSVDEAITRNGGFLNLKYGGNACTDGKKCHAFNDVASSTCGAMIIRN